MTELKSRLQRALAADAAPAMDPVFRIQVVLRQQRAALRRQLAEALGFACLGAVLLALAVQAVEEVAGPTSVRLAVTALLVLGYGVFLVHRYVEIPWLGHAVIGQVRSVIAQCWERCKAWI